MRWIRCSISPKITNLNPHKYTNMPKINPMQKFTAAERRRAMMVALLPCLASMNNAVLRTMNLNPEAVRTFASMLADGHPAAQQQNQPTMAGGITDGYTPLGWNALAKTSIRRWYDQLAPFSMFSTEFSEELVPDSAGRVPNKLGVHVYDRSATAYVDDFTPYSDRAGGSMTGVEVTLKKVEGIAKISAYDIARGVDFKEILAAITSTCANGASDVIMEGLKVGTAQGDNPGKTVAGFTVDSAAWDWGYVNSVVAELIQPRVNGIALDPAHYAALKAGDREHFDPQDLDCDWVGKVSNISKLGENVIGLAGAKDGAAIGMAGALNLSGAYSSVEQLTYEGNKLPITISTWYDPNTNLMYAVAASQVGVTVVNKDSVIPLIATA